MTPFAHAMAPAACPADPLLAHQLAQQSGAAPRLADPLAPTNGDWREWTRSAPLTLARAIEQAPQGCLRQCHFSARFNDGEVCAMHAIAFDAPKSFSILQQAGALNPQRQQGQKTLLAFATFFGYSPRVVLAGAPLLHQAMPVSMAKGMGVTTPREQQAHLLLLTSLECQSPALWRRIRGVGLPPTKTDLEPAEWLATLAEVPGADLAWGFSFLRSEYAIGPDHDEDMLSRAFCLHAVSDCPDGRRLGELRTLGAFLQPPSPTIAFAMLSAAMQPPRCPSQDSALSRYLAMKVLAEAFVLPHDAVTWWPSLVLQADTGAGGAPNPQNETTYRWQSALFVFAVDHGLNPQQAHEDGFDLPLLAAEQQLWSVPVFRALFEQGATLDGVGADGRTVLDRLRDTPLTRSDERAAPFGSATHLGKRSALGTRRAPPFDAWLSGLHTEADKAHLANMLLVCRRGLPIERPLAPPRPWVRLATTPIRSAVRALRRPGGKKRGTQDDLASPSLGSSAPKAMARA